MFFFFGFYCFFFCSLKRSIRLLDDSFVREEEANLGGEGVEERVVEEVFKRSSINASVSENLLGEEAGFESGREE